MNANEVTAALNLTRVRDFNDGSLGIVDFPLYPKKEWRESRIARFFFGARAFHDYVEAIETLGFSAEPPPPPPADVDALQWPMCAVVRSVSGRFISFGLLPDGEADLPTGLGGV